jgi:hypothetical protein
MLWALARVSFRAAKIVSCNMKYFFHGLRSKLPQLFYFRDLVLLVPPRLGHLAPASEVGARWPILLRKGPHDHLLLNLLKLILNRQESRSCQSHNMVKFRALLGEASLHKKGTCSVSLTLPSQHREIGTKQKLHFCQYCAKQFKLNWLIIRHEKGCRDRPG